MVAGTLPVTLDRYPQFMGDILALNCSCGYQTEALFVGCGASGPDFCRDLAICSHCSEVTTIRASKKKTCPTCQRQVVVVDVPVLATGGRDTVLLDASCPRCGEQALRVTEMGIWD